MILDEYLKADSNTVFREKLVNYRLFYEIKLASARIQSDIRIYSPEVDRDGFDMILESDYLLKPFQIKVKTKSAKTSAWDIQKNLIRPLPENVELLGFEESPEGDGLEGGFILVIIDVKDDEIADFVYYYTDVYILKAFELGIIDLPKYSQQIKFDEVIEDFSRGGRNEKVSISKNHLVKAKSIDHLLAIAGLHSRYNNQFQGVFKNYLKIKINDLDAQNKQIIQEKLNELIDFG